MNNRKLCHSDIAENAENTAVRFIRSEVFIIWPCLIILLSATAAWPVTVTFTYDSLNRLEKAEYAGGAVFDYTYDKAGSRLGISRSFGLNDVIAVLKLMTGDPGGVFSSADIDADEKIGMQELVYIMQRLAGLRD